MKLFNFFQSTTKQYYNLWNTSTSYTKQEHFPCMIFQSFTLMDFHSEYIFIFSLFLFHFYICYITGYILLWTSAEKFSTLVTFSVLFHFKIITVPRYTFSTFLLLQIFWFTFLIINELYCVQSYTFIAQILINAIILLNISYNVSINCYGITIQIVIVWGIT